MVNALCMNLNDFLPFENVGDSEKYLSHHFHDLNFRLIHWILIQCVPATSQRFPETPCIETSKFQLMSTFLDLAIFLSFLCDMEHLSNCLQQNNISCIISHFLSKLGITDKLWVCPCLTGFSTFVICCPHCKILRLLFAFGHIFWPKATAKARIWGKLFTNLLWHGIKVKFFKWCHNCNENL